MWWRADRTRLADAARVHFPCTNLRELHAPLVLGCLKADDDAASAVVLLLFGQPGEVAHGAG
eukprot:592507-Prymnesium_polylepis.1